MMPLVIWNDLNSCLDRKGYNNNMSLRLCVCACVRVRTHACICYNIDDREEHYLASLMSSQPFTCCVALLDYLHFHKQPLTLHIIIPRYVGSKFLPISYLFFESQFYSQSFSPHSFWPQPWGKVKHSLSFPLRIVYTYL